MLTAEIEEKEEVRTLTASDRCDRCGAEAFVSVYGEQGTLLFCGHHFSKHEDKLRSYAWDIVDERKWINHKPSSGE